jgi:gentisate 1,2-dioxygenase
MTAIGQPDPLSATEMASFREKLAATSLAPLWEIPAHQTASAEAAKLWRWRDIEPLFDHAVRATQMDAAERRVLSLLHPNTPAKGPARVTLNINAGMQILMPGERARPHRHTANALRFVIEGTGASTVVDGKACPMEPGDLVLTPGWTWHEHVHEGQERVVWLDVLDVPLMDYLKVNVFEPGPVRNAPPVVEDAALATPGFMPDYAFNARHSPLFRYPWGKADVAIDAIQPAEDGSRLLRYVNPTTGGSVMSLLDCSLLRIEPGKPTRRRRSTSNAVCFVAQGSGVSTVGEATFEWRKHDVFSLPHGNWISHQANDAKSSLFMVSDIEVLRRLDLLREEVAD